MGTHHLWKQYYENVKRIALGMVSLGLEREDKVAMVTGKAPRLIPRQPAENFCLGYDDAQPVAAYAAIEPFKGAISVLSLVYVSPKNNKQ